MFKCWKVKNISILLSGVDKLYAINDIKETVEKKISDDRGTPSLKGLYCTNDMS